MNKPNYKYGDNAPSIKMGGITIDWCPIHEAYALPIGKPDKHGDSDVWLLIDSEDNGIHWTPRIQAPLEECTEHDPNDAAKFTLELLKSLNSALSNLLDKDSKDIFKDLCGSDGSCGSCGSCGCS